MARIVLLIVCCLVVPCLTLNTALANVTETAVRDSDENEALSVCNARPRYGAIVRKVGEASFVEGELLVSSRLNHISDMENNIVEVLRLGINVLSHIRQVSSNLSKLDRLNLAKLANDCSFIYFLLIEEMSSEFLNKLNLGNRYQMAERWNKAVKAAVWGNSSVPHPLHAKGRLHTYEDETNFRNLERAIINFYNEGKKREKRGIIDGGGWLLSKTFGVATEKELHAQKVELMKAEEEIKLSLSGAKEAFEASLRNIAQMQQGLEEEFTNMEEFERADRLVDQLEHLFSLLQFLYTVSQEVENRRSLLLNGVVPAVVSKETMEMLIEEGRRKFKDLEFPLQVKTDAEFYESLKLLTVKASADPNIFTIILPFVNRNRDSEVYQVRPFPTWTTSKETVWVNNIEQFLLMDRSSFETMPSLRKCKQAKANYYLCPNGREREGLTTASCEVALSTQNESRVIEECHYEKFDGSVHAAPVGDAWIVFTRNETIGNTNCGRKRTERLRKYENTFCVPRSCGLDTEALTIHASQKAESTLRTKVHQLPIEELSNAKVRRGPKEMLDQLHKRLNASIRALHEEHRNKLHSQVITTHTSWGMGSLIIITVLLIFLFLGIRYSRERRRKVAEPEMEEMASMLNHGTERNAGETTVNITQETIMAPPVGLITATPLPRIPIGPQPSTSGYLQPRRVSTDNDIYDSINEDADIDHGYRPQRAEEAKVDEKKKTGRIIFIR